MMKLILVTLLALTSETALAFAHKRRFHQELYSKLDQSRVEAPGVTLTENPNEPRTAISLNNDTDHSPHKRWGYRVTDRWQGADFFEGWSFYSDSDPTHGTVNFLDAEKAHKTGLAYVQPDGTAVMKVDSISDLALGTPRNSIRISSQKAYNGGLFILDAAQLPFGCAVWPAFWMFGPNWPNNGEIDIFEGVNLGTTNQYTAHTASCCSISSEFPLSPSTHPLTRPLMSQSIVSQKDCGPSPSNTGCAFIDTNRASYGKALNDAGGAVIAMEWRPKGEIKIWNFPRNHVPRDIVAGTPDPLLWPISYLKASWGTGSTGSGTPACDTGKYFNQMNLIFDITLCGDWAGAAYPSSGCPGSCQDRIMTGSNFIDAVWKINSVTVYN